MKLFVVTWSGLTKKGARRIMQRRYYGSSAEEVFSAWHMYSRTGDDLISIEAAAR